MNMKYTKEDKETALKHLKEWLKAGDKVYTTIDHVVPSGMTRWLQVFLVRDNQKINISWHCAVLLDLPYNTGGHYGVRVGGCGMDMGFHLVYTMSRVLFPEGSGTERDGGYTLVHSWW